MEDRNQIRERLVKTGVFDEYCKQRNEYFEKLLDENLEAFEREKSDDPDEEAFFQEWDEWDARNKTYSELYKLEVPERYNLTEEEWKECEALRQVKKNHRTSIRKHLEWMAENCPEDCVLLWVTMKESDELQARLDQEKRVRTARRLLKKYCEDYDGNIDFGGETDREHFHFVALVPNKNVGSKEIEIVDKLGRKRKMTIPTLPELENEWQSHITVRKLYTSQKSLKKTSAYMSKLVSHAIKSTAGRRIVARGTAYQDFLKAEKEARQRTLDTLDGMFGKNGYRVTNLTEQDRKFLNHLKVTDSTEDGEEE